MAVLGRDSCFSIRAKYNAGQRARASAGSVVQVLEVDESVWGRQATSGGESGPVGAHMGGDGAVQPDGGGALRPATRTRDVRCGDSSVKQALGPSFAHGVAGVGRRVEAGRVECLAQSGQESAAGQRDAHFGQGRHHEQWAMAIVEGAHVRLVHTEVLAHGVQRRRCSAVADQGHVHASASGVSLAVGQV